ncbi:MAG: reverse transcriptase domain-containing protein [Plesiomonas shigelloides]
MDKQQNNKFMPDRSGPGLPTTAHPIEGLQGGGDKFVTGTKPSIKLPSQGVTIGTWNVRTLYQCGKVKELTHELNRYRWDVVGLAEVRWTGFGETTTDDGHKIWFSGKETKHEHGVAFIVRKEVVGTVISCTPVSSRLISIRISARPQNLTIIQVYAPTADHDDEEIEEFYEQLDNIIKTTPKKDILTVIGDWNAKIGPDAFQQWAGTVGKFGLGETNDRGLRLLEFAQSHRLTVANTLHPHKKSRRVTWQAPGGLVQNQVDFILLPQRFKSSINKAQTRSFPGADIGSDHNLVLTSIKLKLTTSKPDCKSPRIRFDLQKLKDPAILEIFQAQVGGRFAALVTLDCDVDTLAGTVKEVLTSTAEKVLGKQRKRKQPWVTDDILDLCDKRRTWKRKKDQDLSSANEYRLVNNQIRKMMRVAKEAWIEDQCRDVEEGMVNGNSKKAYQTIKTLTKTQQRSAKVIENSNGQLLTENAAVLNRWTEYCRDLYNHKTEPDTNILQNDQYEVRKAEDVPVLAEEVEAAIRSLKGGKSPGVDNVPAELLKLGGEMTTKILTILCQKIWEQKKWPVQWTQSLVIPLPKKGNLKQCENYRTISLISHASKVMLRIILNRLKPFAEELLSEEQAGFRVGRSAVEQIFNCRVLIEKHLQHQRELHHNFIDFKKAFDRVWHVGLWHVMRSFNIEEGLIQMVEALYKNACSAVLLNNQLGEFFRTTIGVRQGCLLSPVLFNIFLEKIMQETLHDHQTSISIGGRPLSNLRFADDIDLMAGSNTELQNLTNKLSRIAGSYGMEISTDKSKVMTNSTNDRNNKIYVNGQRLEEVNSFKYLGASLSKDGSCTAEIRIRIAAAASAMARLDRIWRSNSISFTTKYRLYKSLVLSILLYGCEAWTMLAEPERKIQAFENKCLRKLLRISYREHKTNEYVRNTITSLVGPHEPLLATVKRRKLAWFGHVTRHNTLSKTILQGTLEGSRRRGRQRKNWVANIKEWTKLEMPELLATAQNRTQWRAVSVAAAFRSPQRSIRARD